MTLRLSTGLRNRMLGITTEKITNGTFESATTSWTASGSSLSLAGAGANGTSDSLRVTDSGGGNGYAYQAITCKCGHVYRLQAWFKKGTGTTGRIAAGTTANGTDLCSKSVTDATFTQHIQYFLVPGTNGDTDQVYINFLADGAGQYHDYDEVQVTPMAHAVQDVFKGGSIEIYTGLQPSSANDAPTGTLLVTIMYSSAGITFDDAASGILTKADAETWSGVCVATGTAGWARLLTPTDGGASSTTDERMDMAVGTSGAQIHMSSTSFATGATQTLTELSITLPAS